MTPPFVLGARRSRRDARLDLIEIEAFFLGEGLFGPAGMAHVAADWLRSGATDAEVRVLLRAAIAAARAFRSTTHFDFTALGMAQGGYCLIARVLFGVLRPPPGQWRNVSMSSRE